MSGLPSWLKSPVATPVGSNVEGISTGLPKVCEATGNASTTNSKTTTNACSRNPHLNQGTKISKKRLTIARIIAVEHHNLHSNQYGMTWSIPSSEQNNLDYATRHHILCA